MTSKISNLTFTDEDDIASMSAVEQILNTEVANTLATDDIIIGTGNDYGFENISVLSTDDSNDTITGIENLDPEFDSSYDLVNSGTLKADEDNDLLTGTLREDDLVSSGTLKADEDNDIITGTASRNGLRGGTDPYTMLRIHSITCVKNGADFLRSPDDTYMTVNGTEMWGDYSMIRGLTRFVNISSTFFIPTNQSLSPRIELFDRDNGSRDDSLGGFTASPAFLHDYRVQEVCGSGSIYKIYYSFGFCNSLDCF